MTRSSMHAIITKSMTCIVPAYRQMDVRTPSSGHKQARTISLL